MLKFKTMIVSLVIIGLIGCTTTKPFEPPSLQPSKFDKTEPYKLDLSALDAAKPAEPPKPIYAMMDQANNSVTITNDVKHANCIIFLPQEYAKVGSVVKYASVLKEVATQEESLINTRIDEINALKELCAIKDAQIEQYRNMYIEAMKLYTEEKKSHHRDNIRHDIKELLLFGGTIAVVCSLG